MERPKEAFKLEAKVHVGKLLKHLKGAGISEGVIFHNGGVILNRYDTDVELPFRQESNFFYLTGVEEAGFNLLIDVASSKSILVAPNIDREDAMWRGLPDPLDILRKQYDVDEVIYFVEFFKKLDELNPKTLFVFNNTDCKVLGDKYHSILDKKTAVWPLWDARLIKTKQEIDLMREANRISSNAHIQLMKDARPGMNEGELEALFAYETSRRGCKHQAYGCICGSGTSSSILHYTRNDKWTNKEDPEQLVLVDAGAEHHCYASDITRTWPIGGKYVGEAKIIYEIVYEMQEAVMQAMKPGVPWENMHRLANEIGCKGLVKAGLLHGEIEELVNSHVPAVFFPHGLGHLIGLDVHDVGGYPEGTERIQAPGIRYLRFRRNLEVGMVVTVEPGIYFGQVLVEDALDDDSIKKFINLEALERFRKIGGVRIEDCVVITENGIENLTKIPRKLSEIEALMDHSSKN
eukprot:TRINITY_DN1007_c0_g1_i1.p1 TRINITY_DN1007_c0_g1~~TRINITY_DN1007_c0_g1_i1.p1  ORF type:complete len:486 (-),score=189.59 TRINITY_DN1007_c0_g1_i1:22-1410(-)